MCGVIVVDAARIRTTCLGRDAYIHDHCLGYRRDYSFFYQLPNSNFSTHRMLFLGREASSENYGPQVYFYHITKTKNTLLQFIDVYFISRFFYLLYLSLPDLILASNREGIDNPFIALGASICLFV